MNDDSSRVRRGDCYTAVAGAIGACGPGSAFCCHFYFCLFLRRSQKFRWFEVPLFLCVCTGHRIRSSHKCYLGCPEGGDRSRKASTGVSLGVWGQS